MNVHSIGFRPKQWKTYPWERTDTQLFVVLSHPQYGSAAEIQELHKINIHQIRAKHHRGFKMAISKLYTPVIQIAAALL